MKAGYWWEPPLFPDEKGLDRMPSWLPHPHPLIASNNVIYSFTVFLGCVPIRLSVPVEAGISICLGSAEAL